MVSSLKPSLTKGVKTAGEPSSEASEGEKNIGLCLADMFLAEMMRGANCEDMGMLVDMFVFSCRSLERLRGEREPRGVL